MAVLASARRRAAGAPPRCCCDAARDALLPRLLRPRRLTAHPPEQADPSFARTVVVSTKLDTKFAQFGHVDELRAFLLASQLRSAHPQLLGGPYFTSVPAGRVGSSAQHAYRDNDGFRAALATQAPYTCSECRMLARSLTADPRHNNRRAPTARTCRPSSAARAPSSPTPSGSTASGSRG